MLRKTQHQFRGAYVSLEEEIPQKAGVESVKRAFSILRCFSLNRAELGVTEISRELGVHKSTVSRLLSTLESERVVIRNPESGRYRLGVGLLELSGFVTLHADLRRVARSFMNQLAQLTQETVNLAVIEGDEVVNIEHITPFGRRVMNIGWVGRRTPLHASSTGKVLMAYLPRPDLEAILQKPLVKFTEHTLVELSELQAEMGLIHEQGYATGLEELEIGLNAIAAPIRDHTGRVIAALSTAGPAYRLSKERIKEVLAPLVLDYVKQISLELGYLEESETTAESNS
jgi:IclR family acetate operon transcriptional repressor